MEKIKILSGETFRLYLSKADEEVSKIPARYRQKRYHKQYNTLTALINSTETETISKLQPLTKYTVLVYETINLGNSTYACYTKVYKLLSNLTIKKETPQFYITNWGRIAKKRILAIVVD